MSRAADALRAAAHAGVSVALGADGRLVLEAAAEPPAAIIAALKEYKVEIVKLLTIAEPSATPPRPRADTAGRNGGGHDDAAAAIAEHNGCRAWAEAEALMPSRAPWPHDVPDRAWDRARADFKAFCTRWAGPANAMGWTPADVLGWDPRWERYSPIAKLGIIWKFEGAVAVEVKRDAVTIVRNGILTTLRRS